MHSRNTWTYQRRGGSVPLVLLPGWATDVRIFADLPLSGDTITPTGMLTGPIDSLAEMLDAWQCGPVCLLGWSLGGFAAAAFARAYPQWVDTLILAGVRPRYPHEQIDRLAQALRQDMAQGLTAFYRQCFLPSQRASYRHFRATLEPAYLAEFALDELLAGLAYLAAAELTRDAWPTCPVTFMHGVHDLIAPVAEVCRLAETTGAPLHLVPKAGHTVFLVPEFLRVAGYG